MKLAVTLALSLVISSYALTGCAFSPTDSIEIELLTEQDYNVFPPGESFQVRIRPVVNEEIETELRYQWVDFRGDALTEPQILTPNQATTIASPFAEMPTGYYGLRFESANPRVSFNASSGNRREFGFAVLARIEDRAVNPESRFGIVHFDHDDPHLNPGWIKTASEHQIGWSGSARERAVWHQRLEANRERGQLELPLIFGETWNTGSVSEIAAMLREIFLSDPRPEGTPWIPAYELGLEENLLDGNFAKHLEASLEKFRAVRHERNAIDPSVQLVYQVAGTSLRPYRQLVKSSLVHEIDVLAAHPYPWSDWPSPDSWHDEFIRDLNRLMDAQGVRLPVWYTEVGSSQNDAGVPLMFSGSMPVGNGQTRDEYAAYLIKLHAYALAAGIEKIFWYNYRDRDTSVTDAEDHFGLIDFWGHPKPGYLAYAALLRCAKNRPEVSRPETTQGKIFVLADDETACLIAWNPKSGSSEIALTDLLPGLTNERVLEAYDAVGTPVETDNNVITINSNPVFVVFEYPQGSIH